MKRSVRGRFGTGTLLERAGWVPFASVIGAVVIASVAGITWNTSPYYGRNDQVTLAETGNVGAIPSAGGKDDVGKYDVGKYDVKVSPNRIEIPKLNVQAPIVDVGTTRNGELDVPINPKVVGWWSPGAKPGASVGTSIFAGHINYAGVTGTFADIGKLAPGDTIEVYGKLGAARKLIEFEVTGVRTYHKTALPYKDIFDQKSVGRMALVTCGGPFDTSTGSYLDNIVVFAVPTGSRTA